MNETIKELIKNESIKQIFELIETELKTHNLKLRVGIENKRNVNVIYKKITLTDVPYPSVRNENYCIYNLGEVLTNYIIEHNLTKEINILVSISEGIEIFYDLHPTAKTLKLEVLDVNQCCCYFDNNVFGDRKDPVLVNNLLNVRLNGQLYKNIFIIKNGKTSNVRITIAEGKVYVLKTIY